MILDPVSREFPPAAAESAVCHQAPALISSDPRAVLCLEALPPQVRSGGVSVSTDLLRTVRELCRALYILLFQSGCKGVGRLEPVLFGSPQMEPGPQDFKSVQTHVLGDPVQFFAKERQGCAGSACFFSRCQFSRSALCQRFFAEFFKEAYGFTIF